MAVNTVPNFAASTVSKNLLRIAGLVCLAGFTVDFVALITPPNVMDLEWRINFLRQLGDRSIVLFLGATLMLSSFEDRRKLRKFSLAMLTIGVFLFVSSLLVIRDGLILQSQTIQTISNQASQLQTQIQQAQANPSALPANVTPEQLAQASQQLADQAETLKQNARLSVTRIGFASIGNLVVVGMGLVGLGRYGLKHR